MSLVKLIQQPTPKHLENLPDMFLLIAQQKQRDGLNVRTIMFAHKLDRLGHVRHGVDTARAQRQHQPAQHRQIVLLRRGSMRGRAVRQYIRDADCRDAYAVRARENNLADIHHSQRQTRLMSSADRSCDLNNIAPHRSFW